ncbi:hypothetical protein [Nocardia sp. NPDC059691]|uniref:hypothetical protein n=1 Tax=Nocardia sp. NPDC059691 TaxID=3346908 RepID=UPI0036A7BC4E
MMYWNGDGAQWWMFVPMILLAVPLWIAVAIALVAVLHPVPGAPADLDRRAQQ